MAKDYYNVVYNALVSFIWRLNSLCSVVIYSLQRLNISNI